MFYVYLFVFSCSLVSMFPGLLNPIMAAYLSLLILGEWTISSVKIKQCDGCKLGPNISRWTEREQCQ